MSPAVRSLDDRLFRSHPDIAAVPLEHLSGPSRRALNGALFGMLRSKSTGHDVMAIDVETAVLFLSFEATGVRPWTPLASQPNAHLLLARLVADGVLQLQRADGVFVDRWDAIPELFTDPVTPPPPSAHPLIRQSYLAVQHASKLSHFDSTTLAQRLYQSNAYPRTLVWEEQLPSHRSTMTWLGTTTIRSLSSEYTLKPAARGEQWLRWWSRRLDPHTVPRFKIYVSPHPSQIRQVFRQVVACACDLQVSALKIGRGVLGLLRPDKFVLYFTHLDDLWRAARELTPLLTGCPPHGVPFSAVIDEAGLLSWAIDPPSQRTSGLASGSSWRAFVSLQLGRALAVDARCDSDQLVAFAVRRLQLEGVDPERWHLVDGW